LGEGQKVTDQQGGSVDRRLNLAKRLATGFRVGCAGRDLCLQTDTGERRSDLVGSGSSELGLTLACAFYARHQMVHGIDDGVKLGCVCGRV